MEPAFHLSWVAEEQGARGLIELSVSLARRSEWEQAARCLTEALRLEPDLAHAHHNLGVALAELGKLGPAADSFRQAIRLVPDYVEAHLNLANTLTHLDQRQEALPHFRRALALRPNSAECLNAMGLTLTELGQSAEASVHLAQAVRLKPDFIAAYNSLGLALGEQARWAEAEAAFEAALHLDPRYVEAHTNLASMYAHQARLPEALAGYDLALWTCRDSVTARWNRSLSLLQSGNFESGFREYEWRWRRKLSPMRPMTMPVWDGSPLRGKRLLLWPEQGLGDTIQFVRYAALLREQGAQVSFECPDALRLLLTSCRGFDRMIRAGADADVDLHAPLMSLPKLLGTTLSTVPATVPYLSADPQRSAPWRQRLGDGAGLKVGIAWQGNPRHQWDRHRSVPLAALEPLARLDGVRLISVQRGPGAEQVRDVEWHRRVTEVLPLTSNDAVAWAEVAAVMSNLDLVITVDTAIAHLAGAMGVRVYVALSALCDWRWMLEREDSPWYPTMRLFRQERLGEWGPVFLHLADELRQLSRTTLNSRADTGG